MRILVVGFGPFLDISDNPAARLAREIDGMDREGLSLIGRVMPVSFRRAITETWAHRFASEADAVLGIGIARSRRVVTVEAVGRNVADGSTPDVDGERWSVIEPGGPEALPATFPAEPLARFLGAVVGRDAGRYVCNAWIYQMLRGSPPDLPIGFIHIPPAGLQASRLADALSQLVAGSQDGRTPWLAGSAPMRTSPSTI